MFSLVINDLRDVGLYGDIEVGLEWPFIKTCVQILALRLQKVVDPWCRGTLLNTKSSLYIIPLNYCGLPQTIFSGI